MEHQETNAPEQELIAAETVSATTRKRGARQSILLASIRHGYIGPDAFKSTTRRGIGDNDILAFVYVVCSQISHNAKALMRLGNFWGPEGCSAELDLNAKFAS
eukprot:scaffold299397_cov18-Prasinocladus_malaysianus.AAC.1